MDVPSIASKVLCNIEEMPLQNPPRGNPFLSIGPNVVQNYSTSNSDKHLRICDDKPFQFVA